MIVKKLVRDQARVAGMLVGSEFYPALSKVVEGAIAKAIERALANGRKTLRTEDLQEAVK